MVCWSVIILGSSLLEIWVCFLLLLPLLSFFFLISIILFWYEGRWTSIRWWQWIRVRHFIRSYLLWKVMRLAFEGSCILRRWKVLMSAILCRRWNFLWFWIRNLLWSWIRNLLWSWERNFLRSWERNFLRSRKGRRRNF